MRWSPTLVLQAMADHLPKPLVGPRELDACGRIAADIPASIDSYYLECRLNAEPRVDFLVLTGDKAGAARDFEAALGPARSRGAWSRNLSLLHGWSGSDPAIEDARLVWFEYDVDERFDREAPSASPSLCLERDYFSRTHGRPSIDLLAARRRAHGALSHLVGDDRRPAVEQVVDRCLTSLPPGGSLIYVSEMLTRVPTATKLYLSVPKSGAIGFLRAIGWPGDLAKAQALLASTHHDITETVFFDLTVTDQLMARLGIAFSQFHGVEMASFDPSWGWLPMPGALEEKRAALKSWPGESEIRIHGCRCRLLRWLDIKLVLEETQEVQYKAYLGFKPALRQLPA